MQRSLAAAGAMALALSSAAYAQQAQPQASSGTTRLEPILVTDGRTPVEQRKSGRAFTVITGEQLEANQVRYVADALRTVPGFSVSRGGSYGGPTQIRVRGAEGNHLLVMIDGVEVSETSTGEYDFGGLIVDDVDRIEVLRGPQSAFWGSNALAGVVNIITKRGERNGFTASARTEGGTDGTFLGGVTLRGGGENYDLALSGAFRRTDGFNVSDFGTEKDGDRNGTLNGKVTVDLTPDLSVDGTLRYVNRRSDTDPQDFNFGSPTYGRIIDGVENTATRELFGSVGATLTSFDGLLTQSARFSGSDTLRNNHELGAGDSWSKGKRLTGSYQATLEFDAENVRTRITGGYEWEQETFRPSHLTSTFERTTHAFIGEYRGEFFDQFFVNAAVRHDMNDRFADATTYSLSAAWQIPDTGTRLHASLGTGVTNPTFFEQFGFVPASFAGNANLIPEKSFGWDAGIEQSFFDGVLVADVTYFEQNLTNEIATVFGGAPLFLSTPINHSGVSQRRGVEVSAALNLTSGFSATASYTYTHATEQTLAGGPRLDEVRRPRHAGSLGLAYSFLEDRARVFTDIVFNGDMLDNAFVPGLPARVTLPAYTVVNVGGSYKFNEHFEAFARVENLFDERYEEVFSYNTPGRTAFLGVKGSF
ncbi:MAG: TonB-dependent receptor plug domain-containing protein [Rhizobiaceae bacterium]